jgi:RHS repeat-associated protein
MAFCIVFNSRRCLLALAAVLGLASVSNRASAQTCPTLDPPCPHNYAPQITISPRSNPDTLSGTVVVTVTVSDDRVLSNGPTSSSAGMSGFSGNWNETSTQGTFVGTMTLTNGNNTLIVSITDNDMVTKSDTVSFYYHELPASPPSAAAPAVALNSYSNTVRSVGGCSGCLYGGASYSTPAYVSRDIPRSVTLNYSSAQAVPRGFVQADALIYTSGAPSNVSMRIIHGGANRSLTNGGTSAWYTGMVGMMRLGAQFDASGATDAVYHDSIGVTATYSGTPYETILPVRVLILNESNSVLGAGWSVAGLQRLHFVTDSVAITDGSGGITFYRKTSSSAFATEYGAVDALTTNGSTYTLTSSDGGWVHFSSAGLMTSSGGRYTGDSTAYAYDGSNRLSTITDEVGEVTTFTYAPDGLCLSGATSGTLCAITTPGGRVSKFVVDGSGDLVTIVDPDGATAFSGSYSSHKLTSAVDRLGSTTSLAYDSFTGLSSVTAQSVTTTDTAGNTTTQSPVTTYRSIEATLLSTSNSSSGSAKAYVRWDTAYAYVTAPNGTAVRMLLMASGEPSFVETVPVSGPTRTTRILYNSNYLASSITAEPVGGTIIYQWGGRDTLKSITDPMGTKTTFYYSSHFLDVDSVAVAGTVVQRNTFSTASGAWNLWKSKYGNMEVVDTLDSHGRPTRISAGGWTTPFWYHSTGFQNRDSVGLLFYPWNTRSRFVHDAYGRDSVITSPTSQVTTMTYDLMNRLTSVTQPGSAVTSLGLSENTSTHTTTTTVTDPRSLVFSSVTGALGWGTSSTDPQSHTSTAGYDRNGFVRRAVDRAGGVVTARYDSLGRPVSITANGNTTSFAYDAITTPAATHWTVAANAESRDSVNTDGLGRLTSASASRGGVASTIVNGYHLGDRSFTIITTGNSVDTLVFGNDSVHFPYQVPSFGHNYAHLTYTTSGLLQYMEFANGGFVYRTRFSPFQRPETLTVMAAEGNNEPRAYTYDNLGRISSFNHGDETRDITDRIYTYDARGRLSGYSDTRSVVVDSAQDDCDPEEWCDPDRPYTWFGWENQYLKNVSFSPDLSGNRTDGSASLSNDRLSSMTASDGVSYSFTYDNEGRRTAKTASGYSQTYGWNDLSQLIWVKTNGDSVAYGYDAAGRRVRKYASGTTTYYLWDGDNLVMELNSSGNPIRKYAYRGLDQPIAVTIGSNTYNMPTDEEGNVMGLWDQSGTRVAKYIYDPFGYQLADTASVTQPLRWKGREFDSETGLYYMRARYYDPTVGRFISEDPLGVAAGINPYTFADGDPVNGADPTGLTANLCDIGAVCIFDLWNYEQQLAAAYAAFASALYDFGFGQLNVNGGWGAGQGPVNGGGGAGPVGPKRRAASESKRQCSDVKNEVQLTTGLSGTVGGLLSFIGGGVDFGFGTSGHLFVEGHGELLTGLGGFLSFGPGFGVTVAPRPAGSERSSTSVVGVATGNVGWVAGGAGGTVTVDANGRPGYQGSLRGGVAIGGMVAAGVSGSASYDLLRIPALGRFLQGCR